MAPFRPANINKRLYPGNANVIGPTTQATLGLSTTICSSKTLVCTCSNNVNVLGCRFTRCGCPCCCVTYNCNSTTNTPSVPSGMWKSSEQYNAALCNSWSGITTTFSAPVSVGATSYGFICTGGVDQIDCKGFFICLNTSTGCKWFVAPACTQVSRFWAYNQYNDAVTVANACMGACGWFVPGISAGVNPGYCCRIYWDSYCATDYWTSDTGNGWPCWVSMVYGNACNCNFRGYTLQCVRAFRCDPF